MSELKDVRKALCLMNSMIEGGESHSETSMLMFEKALSDIDTRPNDAKKMILRERVAELACAELDKEYAYKMFSHKKPNGEPVEKQVSALEYFIREARLELSKQSSEGEEG